MLSAEELIIAGVMRMALEMCSRMPVFAVVPFDFSTLIILDSCHWYRFRSNLSTDAFIARTSGTSAHPIEGLSKEVKAFLAL